MNLAELILSTERETHHARDFYFEGEIEYATDTLKEIADNIQAAFPAPKQTVRAAADEDENL